MIAYLVLIFVSLTTCTNVPIIGILSQETFSVNHLFPDETYHSFIGASYVKYLESAGARVVPIMIGKNLEYYTKVINYTNGILFPGGATFFNNTDGFADSGKIIYDLAVKRNEDGDYYPIWGTCLGYELMIYVANNKEEIRSDCSAVNVAMPLNFKKGFRLSRMFGNASNEIIRILRTQDVTYNSHRYCITKESLENSHLNGNWQILSTNQDVNGFEFISTFENLKYPFYGIQFHPEKNRFEFRYVNIPHTRGAVKISQYFAEFFVNECRKNNHSYPDWTSEQDALIYNYDPVFTGKMNSSYLQLYMFRETD